MIRFTRVAGEPADAAARAAAIRLRLGWDERTRSRYAGMLDTGEAVAWVLPRGTVLRDGAWLGSEDGRHARIEAAAQPLLRVTAPTPLALLRAVYHLANRHVAAQILDGELRIEPDPVLAALLRQLGAAVEPIEAPFDPESGAYAHGHGARGGHSHAGDAPDETSATVGEQLSIAAHERRAATARAPDASGSGGGCGGLLAALQLASPALPVGGFAYSEGLEKAIEDGIVRDEPTAQRWIDDLLRHVIARTESPLWLRAYDAAAAGDDARLASIHQELLAMRETAELRAQSLQMGASLAKTFAALGSPAPSLAPIVYPVAFACACAGLRIDRLQGLAVALWSWTENQVLVALKTVPLGQIAGQRMLTALRPSIDAAVAVAAALRDDEIGSAPLGWAMACAAHETQYSRLFRS
jgi:urease accessory protein